jgi:putative toxin-antitoxin system antitoxin component (TIGR02293 family)
MVLNLISRLEHAVLAKVGLVMKNDEERLVAITKAAQEFFVNDNEAAQRWLNHPVHGLGLKRPVDMIHTDEDTEIVLNLIGCLEHGMFV